jgi:uncharacterized protein involved in exopolysaccharide biosynthesis
MQGGSVPSASPKPAVLPEANERPAPPGASHEIDLVAVGLLMWAHRYWLFVAVLIATAAAAYVAFTTPPTYRADVVSTQVKEQSMGGGGAALASQLSSLVNISGLAGFAADRSERDAEAVLESRRLVQEFISRNDILAQLSPDPKKRPTLWRAVQRFQKGVVSIREDPRRGITTLSVEWTDPATAARWANGLVALANELIRTHALEEAQRNIAYLNAQSEHTTEVDLRRVIFNLIQNETKTLMLANGRPEYAFRIVDPAVPPEIRSGPHRTLILSTGLAVGLFAGAMLVLAWDWLRRQRARLRRDA